MSLVEKLMRTAAADTDLLGVLNRQGDDLSVSRVVDFLVRAPSREKADTVAGFINDCQYGMATAGESNGEYAVTIAIHMPIQQHLALSVSGFIECIAALFGLDYDGWECTPQQRGLHRQEP